MNYLTLIQSPITLELERFESVFVNSLTSSNPLLNSVTQYILQKRGKRMRSMLVLLTAKLLGEVTGCTLHAAASLELLHTASLVHDDVVDESSRRRGQRSVNAAYGNKVSVLAGDYLLATALQEVRLSHNFEIFSVITRLGQELAEGELLQLSNVSNTDFSESVYFDIIRKKTAALFSACTRTGALSVLDVSDEKVENARLFGEYVGLCFQIKDDIFDYFESQELGKPTGHDMAEGKLTLPVLHALNTAGDADTVALAMKVKRGEADADEIARLVRFAKEQGGIEYAAGVMNDYRDRARALLDPLPDGEVKQALSAYLDYVVDREK